MAKRSYTWYPMDWATDSAVFDLSLEQRGFYRELIDLVMLRQGSIEIDVGAWSKKFTASETSIYELIGSLERVGLIEIDGGMIEIPSCRKRLELMDRVSRSSSKT